MNYYTFLDELTPQGVNSLLPPSKWMLCTKIDRSRQRTLNSGSYLIGMIFTAYWKCRSAETGVPRSPRGWLRSARKKGGPPITSIFIYICRKERFFPLNVFFYWKLCLWGLTFFVAGCTYFSINIDGVVVRTTSLRGWGKRKRKGRYKKQWNYWGKKIKRAAKIHMRSRYECYSRR